MPLFRIPLKTIKIVVLEVLKCPGQVPLSVKVMLNRNFNSRDRKDIKEVDKIINAIAESKYGNCDSLQKGIPLQSRTRILLRKNPSILIITFTTPCNKKTSSHRLTGDQVENGVFN